MTDRKIRCAIYTRKSTEEGLEQAFNSLDAQREACAAYVSSQAGEGWMGLSTAYDDGGFSGGDMSRPSLRRLLIDATARKFDVVVVYKVDRLTRSLADFAKIVEVFDAHGVSFVSVTQAFNTTSSMGRLTLNVLLSFAQFEREVTGERIRDKIAASKAKGMWMGGMVPLGYDVSGRTLVPNLAETARLRRMFSRYLELGSVPKLKLEMDRAGQHSKQWVSKRGRVMGGVRLTCGAIGYILKNRIYLGEIVHKGRIHPGQHPALIEKALFQAVQDRLSANGVARRSSSVRAAKVALTGKLFDAEGVAMSPSFSYGRNGRLYRYYVSATILPGRGPGAGKDGTIRRVPAQALDALVLEELRMLLADKGLEWAHASSTVRAVRLQPCRISVELDSSKLSPEEQARCVRSAQGGLLLHIDRRPVFRGGHTLSSDGTRPNRPNPALIKALKNAHGHLRTCGASPMTIDAVQASPTAASDYYARQLMPLGFLAPDIQRAILKGEQPHGLTVRLLLDRGVPLLWREQRIRLAFDSAKIP